MSDDSKRITVKLDADTYRRLRQLGVDLDKTNQAIMVAALVEYLERWDAA